MNRLSALALAALVISPSVFAADPVGDAPSRAYREQIERASPPIRPFERFHLRTTPGSPQRTFHPFRVLRPFSARFEVPPTFLQATPELSLPSVSPDPAARFAEPIRLSLDGLLFPSAKP